MDAVRWDRIQDLFHGALALEAPSRQPFLEAECPDDPALVAEVLTLLAEDERSSGLLDHGLAEAASAVLGEASPPPELPAPYRLLGVLGEGGMGVVYLAERTDLGSRVAIKVLRDASVSPFRRERFRVEQRTLARLAHSNIARLYDAGVLADGTPFLVMEHVEGVPLTDYCDAHRCTVAERLRLFRAICEAVQFAHTHAIVHRDLKPSNVLVTADGTVKLLDFGIAKQLDSLDSTADQTRTALRLMTPAYAAPEQLRGEPVGIYTDVYALGVLLYELLAGRRPFDPSHRSPGEVEAQVLEAEPEKPSVAARRAGRSASRAAWAELDVLCLTAMQKDPRRRYATVDALIRDLDHYLRGEPLEARPDTARYRLRKFLGRNRQAVVAAALVLVAAVATIAFYTVRLARARDAALAQAARTQRIQRFMLDLFQGGDEEAGPADTLRVVTVVDRGVREARTLDREPRVQAELYGTLGGIYRKLGNFPRADSLLEASLGRRRTLYGADDPEVGSGLVALGLLRADQARYPEAERLVREGLETSRKRLPPDHPAVLEATTALGHVLEERGDYDHAVAVLEGAVRLQSTRTPVDSAALAATLRELADTHFYAGHYDASDSINHRLLDMHRRLYGERHPSIADDLIDLGASQAQRGNYVAAERFYRQALEINRAFYGTEHPEFASNLTMLARALEYQDRYAEARPLLVQALGIQEHAYGPDHPRVASELNELGNIATNTGDYAGAERNFTRMVAIYRKAYGDKHYLIGIALSNLATAYMKAGDYARAEPLFRDAVRRLTAALPPDHVNTGITRILLGRTLTREQRWAEAETESLAGYRIVSRQSDPSVSWLQGARKDLATDYDALGKPDSAAEFRAEWKKYDNGRSEAGGARR